MVSANSLITKTSCGLCLLHILMKEDSSLDLGGGNTHTHTQSKKSKAKSLAAA